MDVNGDFINDPDLGYNVYAIGQVPESISGTNWRVAVFAAQISPDPTDPAAKNVEPDPEDLGGASGGEDVPVALQVVGQTGGIHYFVVTGDLKNADKDILARKYRYEEP